MFMKRFVIAAVAIIVSVCLSGCGGSSPKLAVGSITATADGTSVTAIDALNTVTLTTIITNDASTSGTPARRSLRTARAPARTA